MHPGQAALGAELEHRRVPSEFARLRTLLRMAARHDMHGEVVKVHAAFESAGKQLAQHPTTGLFYISDHVRTSTPAVIHKLQLLQQQQALCQLSRDQAQEAEATVNHLRASGATFCSNMGAQLEQTMLACKALPTPAVTKSGPRVYVTKLPQLLSVSRLNLTKRST